LFALVNEPLLKQWFESAVAISQAVMASLHHPSIDNCSTSASPMEGMVVVIMLNRGQMQACFINENSGSHSSEEEDDSLLGYCTM
jgi:hypothetical protein